MSEIKPLHSAEDLFSVVSSVGLLVAVLIQQSLPLVLAFSVSLGLIAYRLYLQAKREDLDKKLDIRDEIQRLASRLDGIETAQETVLKQAEQVQKLISQANLATAFTPRR